MTACLAGLVFAYLLVVGYAVVSRLLPRRRVVPNLLLSPAIGFAVTELALFMGMRTGEPLQSFCSPLILGLFAAACISLAIARPFWGLRRYSPFALLLTLAFILNGWPLIRYGQDWIGVCTNDMSNYCMAAESFQTHGINLSEADQAEFDSGRDYGYPVRMWYLVEHVRRGVEISLGAFSQTAGRQPTAVCMAFALALHLVLVSATGFLAYRHAQGRKTALWATALMAVSSASTLGLLEQMLGQIGGLALLTAGVSLLCRRAGRLPVMALAYRVVLGGIIISALTIQYTEVLPFLIATVGGVAAIGLVRRRVDWPQLAVVAFSALAGFVCLGKYGFDVLSFLAGQYAMGHGGDCVLNRYHDVYQNGRSLLLIWGMQSRIDPDIMEKVHGIWTWVRIVLAGVGLIACLTTATKLTWRQRAAWATFAGMFAICILMYKSQSWYAVHKMSMYIQPFLAIVVAGLAVATPWRMQRLAMMLLIGLLATNVAAQFRYVRESTSSNCTFPNAAMLGLGSELQAVSTIRAGHVYVAVENLALARLLAIPLYNRQSVMTMTDSWPAMSFPQDGSRTGIERIDSDPIYRGTPAWMVAPADDDYLIGIGQNFTSLNRSRYAGEKPTSLQISPINQLRNHLIFRESRMSTFFYPGGRSDTTFFSPHAATAVLVPALDRSDGMCAIYLGSHVTLQVVNPSPRIRLVMAAKSIQRNWANQLPDASVFGRSRVDFGFDGLGAGRAISPPLEPVTEGSIRTLRVDLKRQNSPVEIEGSRPVGPDDMCTYCRDLSVVPEEAYERYVPPNAIENLQVLREDPLFEYSGIYDDGWVGGSFRARLKSPAHKSELVVRGEVPELGKQDNFETEITVLIDGREIHRQTVTPSSFELRVRGMKPGVQWVECRFSQTRQIKYRSGVSTRLIFLGFEDPQRGG